jgi:ATP-dependent phosphofructokinase / diphosphate-dependent phosphofructokinase
MAILQGKALVAQGGGPTAVINQSLVGVVLEARKFAQVSRVYGALNGVRGIVNEDFLDLSQETTHNLEQVALTPASAMRSTRDKPDEKYCKDMFAVMKAHDVRYFFYIGGNDSSDTVRIVNQQAEKASYELRAIHVPKTIDNDLVVNDHTPGFGSAARFITSAFSGANLDNIALPGVYIAVVMGRHAGFLTAASAIAKRYPDDGPHLVYVPERAFDPKKFVADVQRIYDQYGRCVVAVSEGIMDASGQPIITKLAEGGQVEKDAHGNVQLSGTGALGDMLGEYVKKNTKIKRVRSDTFGYLQRSFLGCVSDVDQHEAREVGERAVQFACWHNVDGSVTIHRTGNYSVDYRITKLEDIAAKTRHMPDEFINAEGNHVTDAFYAYCRPLIGSGLPTPARIRAPKVDKVLGK